MPDRLITCGTAFNKLKRKAARVVQNANNYVDDALACTVTWSDYMAAQRRVSDNQESMLDCQILQVL